MGAIRPFLARWRWWVTVRAERTSSIDKEPWLSCRRAVAWLEKQSWPSTDDFYHTLGELETGNRQIPGASPLNVAALARSMRLTWSFDTTQESAPATNRALRPNRRADAVDRADRAARAAHSPRTWRSNPRRSH